MVALTQFSPSIQSALLSARGNMTSPEKLQQGDFSFLLQRLLFLLIVLATISGCSSQQPAVEESPISSSPIPPISFEVIEERSDGEFLYLVVELSARTEWSSKMIDIEVESLNEGIRVAKRSFGLSELVPVVGFSNTRMLSQKPVRFALSVPAQEATDYQIGLAWRTLEVPEPVPTRNIALASLQAIPVFNDCVSQSSCPVTFRIEGTLQNRSAQTLESVTLAVSFERPEGIENSEEIPQHASFVEVSSLNLKAQAERSFRLAVDYELPYELYLRGIRPRVELNDYSVQ